MIKCKNFIFVFLFLQGFQNLVGMAIYSNLQGFENLAGQPK